MQPVQRVPYDSSSYGDRTYHAEIIDIPVHTARAARWATTWSNHTSNLLWYYSVNGPAA